MKQIPRVRIAIIVTLIVVTVALILAYREELDAISSAGGMDENAAPTLAGLREAATRAPELDAFVMDLWRTGLLPQRRFAIAVIRDRTNDVAEGWETLRPILLSASASGDAQMVADALSALGRFGDRTALAWAARGLVDPDPVVARSWLDYLASLEATEFVREVAKLLATADAETAAQATTILARWTDQPWTLAEDAEPVERNTLAERVREWIDANDDALERPEVGQIRPGDSALQATGVSTEDLAGELVDLATLDGRPWLLYFFSVRSQGYEQGLAAVEALAAKDGSTLNVAHISVDRSTPIYTYTPGVALPTSVDEDLPAVVAVGPPSLGEPMDPGELEAVLTALAARQRVSGPIIIDETGEITRAYAAQVAPALVWIDRQGRVVRRCDGLRTLPVMQRILAEVVPASPSPEPDRPPVDPLDPTNPLRPGLPVNPNPVIPLP